MRVLDLSVWRPGPYTTQLLADLGADVIKVEPPGGDPMRAYPGLFASLSANKRSVVLDLKTGAGRARALDLAGRADVVVEGFRPGVAARLGVGVDDVRAVNPEVVYCSLSGFGQDGPLAPVPGHDLNYLAWAGALAPEAGRAPVEPAVPVADLSAGLAAAFAICAALVRRARTGEGEHIDVALTDVVATWTGAIAPRAAEAAPEGEARVPGYGTFRTRDGGYVALGVINESHFWGPLCDVLGLVDDRDLAFGERMAAHARLTLALTAAIAERDRDELVEALLAADVPVAPVLDRVAMTALAHLRERGAVASDAWLDPNTGHPVRFERRPARRHSPPPAPDEHRGADFG